MILLTIGAEHVDEEVRELERKGLKHICITLIR